MVTAATSTSMLNGLPQGRQNRQSATPPHSTIVTDLKRIPGTARPQSMFEPRDHQRLSRMVRFLQFYFHVYNKMIFYSPFICFSMFYFFSFFFLFSYFSFLLCIFSPFNTVFMLFSCLFFKNILLFLYLFSWSLISLSAYLYFTLSFFLSLLVFNLLSFFSSSSSVYLSCFSLQTTFHLFYPFTLSTLNPIDGCLIVLVNQFFY